jgi:hypothetical protein
MIALERICTYLDSHPKTESARVLANLVRRLESGGEFRLADLYDLPYEEFDLALKTLQQWRLGRYMLAADFAAGDWSPASLT